MKNKFAITALVIYALSLTACGSKVVATNPTPTIDATESSNSSTAPVASPELETKLEELYQNRLEEKEERKKAGPEAETKMETEVEVETEVKTEVEGTQPAIDYHNYLNGNVFNLEAYASALGCRRVQDPEYTKLIMYVVSRPEADFYFLHAGGTIHLFFGDDQNRCWRIGGITPLNGNEGYTIVSEGQDDFNVNSATIEAIDSILSYLTNAKPLNLLTIPSPCDYSIERHEGVLNYYPGGMINEREWGHSIIEDSYYVSVADGTARKMGDNTDITGTTLTVDAL